MKMFSQPLKPTEDWAFKILYFVSGKLSVYSFSLIYYIDWSPNQALPQIAILQKQTYYERAFLKLWKKITYEGTVAHPIKL